jgi:hypothetical protein
VSQPPLRERVANERRRLKTVRQALSAALAQGARDRERLVPFYLAIGDYMEAAMHRLHIQDVRMGEMIRSKLGEPDAAASAALADLDHRLEVNQRHLGEFLQARDALRRERAAGLDRFERVSRQYTDFITANMGHHGAVTDLAQKLLSLDDWAYMAGISDAETQLEKHLFDQVFAHHPGGGTPPAEG